MLQSRVTFSSVAAAAGRLVRRSESAATANDRREEKELP